MTITIRKDNVPLGHSDTVEEVNVILNDLYRIVRAQNEVIEQMRKPKKKTEKMKTEKKTGKSSKKLKTVVKLIILFVLLFGSVAQGQRPWRWDIGGTDAWDRFMRDPQWPGEVRFQGIITLRNGLTIDNATNNALEFNENSDELILTFGSNTVTMSSGDVTTFSFGTVNVDLDAFISNAVTFTLPTADGTTGQQLTTNGSGTLSWAAAGTASAGGSDTQIQYNNGGSTLGGIAGFIWDDTNVELADDVSLAFGTSADWTVNFDDSVDDQLLWLTAATTAGATTDPLFEILVGATPTSDQQVFGVGKGTQVSNTALLTLDEDGDFVVAASITGTAITGTDITATGNVVFGDATTDTVTVTGYIVADVSLDDGSGAPPSLIFRDGSDETATFNKSLSGTLALTTQAADGLEIVVGNLRVGNGTPGTAPMDGEDVYIEGQLEIDQQTTHDAVTVMNEWLDLNEELDIDMDNNDETVEITTSVTDYTADSAVVHIHSTGTADNNTYLLRLENDTANDAQEHFLVLENNSGDDIFAINSGGATTWSMEAAGLVQIDGDTVANTGTAGLLDIDFQTNTANGAAVTITVQQENSATQAYGIYIDLDDDGDGDIFDGVYIANSAGTANTARGLVLANNLDDGIVAAIGAAGQFAVVDAKTAAQTQTSGTLDYSFQSATDNAVFMDIDAQMGNAGANDVVRVIQIAMDDDDSAAAGGEEFIGIDFNSPDMTGNALVTAIKVSESDVAFDAEQGYIRVGTGTEGVTLGDNDMYVTGTFETDGAMQLDNILTMTNGLILSNEVNNRLEMTENSDIFGIIMGSNKIELASCNGTAIDTFDFNDIDALEDIETITGDNGAVIDISVANRVEILENSDKFGLIFGSNKIELASCDGTAIVELDFNDIDVLSDIETLDSGTDAYMKWLTNGKSRKIEYISMCYISATEIRATVPGFGMLCVGLAGVDDLFSTEGYIDLSDGTDYVRFGFQIPSDFIDAGNAQDLQIEFDMHEKAGENVDLEVRFFQYGDTTAYYTDTISITDAAGRDWVTLDSATTGIGDDGDISADDIVYVEITQEGADHAEDVWIYGCRITYETGIENTGT